MSQATQVIGRRRSHRGVDNGFTLLEVMLAMAILGTAIAIIGEVIRTGVRHAEYARDLTYAQMLCQSKLDEIATGVTPATSASDESFDVDTDWLYSVDVEPYSDANLTGLLSVTITVRQNIPEEKQPITFPLTALITDPTLAVNSAQAATDAAAAADSAAASGTTDSTQSSTTGSTTGATSGTTSGASSSTSSSSSSTKSSSSSSSKGTGT